jgi:hypothetical protein
MSGAVPLLTLYAFNGVQKQRTSKKQFLFAEQRKRAAGKAV